LTALPQASRREDYADPRRPAKVGLGIVGLFVGAMALWSTLAPVSGAAVANGNLQVQGKRQTVQHPYGGVVKALRVREGERVERGQVLLSLFDSEPRARLEVLRSERIAALAQEARLMAERDGKDALDIAGPLRERQGEPDVQQAIANESATMIARKRQFQTETEVQERKIAQFNEEIGGTRALADGTHKQAQMLQEEINGVEQLLKSGFATKTRWLALQRDKAKLEADQAARNADVARLQEQISQTKQEIARIERARVSEITDQLRSTQTKLAELGPKVAAAQDVVDRTEIKAPATGSVVGLNVFTEGGVVEPGAKLLDVVPTSNPLMAEARLRLTDINEITPGLRAEVRLVSINNVERPTIYGTVQTVSADRLTDEKSGQGYYAVQVALNEADVRKSNIELQAGMPVDVIVPTKPRTLLQYLVSPLRDELAGAFRER
jgi:HlyD family type I secretion membrane fusion protein